MKAVLLSAAIVLTATAAHAEAPAADALARAVVAAPEARREPGDTLNFARTKSRYANPLPAGIARTSVDRRFGGDDAVGSFGYLCGLNPGQKMTGAAGAAGYDPMGKFLGAKLSIAFH